MNQNKIQDLPTLKMENMENIFQVYTDENDRYFYNLLQTIRIPTDLPKGYYTFYNIKYGDTWPTVSYKFYQTPNLWWVIVAANNILNPVTQPEPGTTIKIIKTEIVRSMLIEIYNQIR